MSDSKTSSNDLTRVLDEVVERVQELEAYAREHHAEGGGLFQHGINDISIKVSLGGAELDVSISGPPVGSEKVVFFDGPGPKAAVRPMVITVPNSSEKNSETITIENGNPALPVKINKGGTRFIDAANLNKPDWG